jgi:hypothetical protein
MLSEGVSTVGAWQFASILFFGMLVMLEFGRRLGIRQRARLGDTHGAGLAAVEGALFALLGLIVAFTFSGAATRFDQRRALIVEEANDIGTAYLRLDLLPADAQPGLRQKFREYADARIEVYRALPNLKLALEHLERANSLQGEIWKLSVSGTQSAPTTVPGMLLLPAVNAMIDITNTRLWSAQTHPPGVIFALLSALALCCALFAGYGMSATAERNWLHRLGFSLVLAAAVFVIMDLEYPRFGLIRIDAFDQAIVDAREAMK